MDIIEAWVIVNVFGLIALMVVRGAYDHFVSKSDQLDVE
jgi:hypothetical protein